MDNITAEFKLEIYNAATSTWLDVAQYVRAGSLQIDQELNSASVMTFELYDSSGEYGGPTVGQQVRCSDVRDNKRVYYFGGPLAIVRRSVLANGLPYVFDCSCQDWTLLLERTWVTASYEDKTSGEIVKDLIAHMPAADRLDVTQVADGPKVSIMNVPTLKIKEALDELSRETGYKYRIGYDKKLYWFAKNYEPASWDLTEVEAATRCLVRPVVERNRALYRNVQEVRGGETTDDSFQTYPGDGAKGVPLEWRMEWVGSPQSSPRQTLSPPLVDLGRPIAEISGCYIAARAEEITPDDIKKGGYGGKWYSAGSTGSSALFSYDVGSSFVRMNEKYTAEELAENDKGERVTTTVYAHTIVPVNKVMYFWCDVKFRHMPQAMVRKDEGFCAAQGIPAQDTIAQNALIEGGSGEVYMFERDDRLKTDTECANKAIALLKEYGTIPTIVSYVSDEWGDLQVGQAQKVSIYGLENKECTIRAIRISDVHGCWLRAEIELVGSEKQGWAQMWRGVYAGNTSSMRQQYVVRPNVLPVMSYYLEREDISITEDITSQAVSDGGKWGAAAIGEGAEWA